MPLLLAGIDEAGYGPTLGPLCVGMALFRIESWQPGDPAPDLWHLLARAICKKPGDRRGRIPIADSKALKLPNDTTTRHPLVHLERGLLSFLRALPDAPAPTTDQALFSLLGATLDDRPWYSGPDTILPLGSTADQLAIAASRIAGALDSAGVQLLDLRCLTIPESAFNQVIRDTGSKSNATARAIGHHLRHILKSQSSSVSSSPPSLPSELSDLNSEISNLKSEISNPLPLRIICDQLGGRTQYEPFLAHELGREVIPLSESGERSRYQIAPDHIVQFMPEAESAHLPVALASMAAKFVRELSMLRFNRYWCARCPELKPTAGYSTDARRWLTDMASTLHPDERAAMVRLA